MNAQAENTNQDIFEDEEITSEGSNLEVEENSDAALNRESSEIALKLVNAVKSMNNGEITHYELVNSFNSSNELKCLFLLVRALPYNPIAKIYPETPFLFFKGVSVPAAFDLSEQTATDIETFMKGQNSEIYSDLRLHDLEQPYLDAYESAIRIYNDMVEKSRDTYHASVKLAKSQVMEVSAVFVCLFIILLTIIGVS